MCVCVREGVCVCVNESERVRVYVRECVGETGERAHQRCRLVQGLGLEFRLVFEKVYLKRAYLATQDARAF